MKNIKLFEILESSLYIEKISILFDYRNVSIYDMVATEDVEILKSTLTEKCAERNLDNDEFHQNTIDLYVHIEKGGAKKEAGQHATEFVKLSGYFAKWSQGSSSTNSKGCCDEHCLPRKYKSRLS